MRQIKAGSADVSVYLNIVDSTDGTPETGVTSASGGLALSYVRNRAAAVGLFESDLAAVDSAHSDGGLIHVGNGIYRVDVPDAAFAAGVDTVEIIGTVTGMVVLRETVQLVGYDPRTELTTTVLSRIDVATSTRAVPGDAMDLITDAIDASSVAASAVTEIAAGVVSGGMSNPITYTYTVYEADAVTPLSDVTVWVSTDSAGTSVVASGTTDNFGEVEFQLDAGTYYVWRQKAGWNFSNPDTEVVS